MSKLACWGCKVLTQSFQWRQATRGIVDSLLEHLDTAGMAETFVRIVGADEQAVPNLPAESLAWLSEMDIIARLLARLAMLACAGFSDKCFGTPSSSPACETTYLAHFSHTFACHLLKASSALCI